MMKVNKLTLGLMIVAASALMGGCGKKEPNVAPEPDTEVQTALDASWMTYVVSDIDMMCSFLGVDVPYEHFYEPIEDSVKGPFSGNIDATRDLSQERLSINFYDCWSKDGIWRRGEVRLIYDPDDKVNPKANPNATYYHRYGFGGLLALSDFRVQRVGDTLPYLLSMPANGTIMNVMATPSDQNMKWKIEAKFKFTHPTDETGNSDMTWEGVFYKTLENRSTPGVVDTTKNPAITWSLAVCGYYGEATGKIGNKPFTFSVKESERLIRDFTCTPDRVGGVSIDPNNNLVQRDETHHPFVKGIASFIIGSQYPRQIYFGNEGNPGLAWQCDNVGEVMIKGIAYRVNFIK